MSNQMKGKICLITGANAGIGKATAKGLAQMGAHVLMVCRSEERGKAAQTEIKQDSGNEQVDLLLADLASQAEIRRLAEEMKSRYEALHVLINNASVIPQERRETEDGLEMQFAVNHLAYFLLTNLLLDLLKVSAPARIINVTSQTHGGVNLDFDDLQSRQSYDPARVYSQTKLMNILFTHELARRLEGSDVTVNCLHPGAVDTELLRDYRGLPHDAPTAGISPEEGAKTSIYLASSPEVAAISGEYFRNRQATRSAPQSYDEEAAARLWQISADLVKDTQ